MGPFIQMPAAPNKWEALAESFKQGIQQGSDIFLQNKLQTMLEDQKTRRNEQMNLRAFGKGYGGIDPKIASALRKMELEYGDQAGLEDVFNKTHNIDGGGVGGGGGAPTSRVGQALQGFGQEPTELPPGQDMMLPYEDMPAEEPFVQPRAIEGARKAIPEQKMSPSKKYEQRVDQLNKDFKDAYSRLKGTKARKDLRSMYNSKMQAIERQRTNDIEDKKLGIKEEQDKREIEKPVVEYISNLKKTHDVNEEKDVNLRAIDKLSTSGSGTKWLKQVSSWLDIDENLLLNPQQETIDKLSNDLMPGIVQKYEGAAGKILKSEADAMARSIPHLYQTEEGRKIVSRYMLKSNELKNVEYDSSIELFKEYRKSGETLPPKADFELQAADRSKEKRAKILEEMHRIATSNPNIKGVEGEKFEVGQDLDTLPKTAPRGTRIQTPSGNVVKFNGMKWEEE